MNDTTDSQARSQSLTETGRWPHPSPRQAILVLGMHRSGTSAVAGVVNALGAAVPKTLPKPDYWNKRGYFESVPFIVALDELLASAGSSWDDWRQFDPQWFHSSEAERHRRKIKALLIDEFGDEPLICLKNPRICRLVPFIWSVLTELGFACYALLPVRNPLEVAQSLKRRDKFSLPKSISLWLRHVLDAEHRSRGMPRRFLTYEGLLSDWRSQIDRATATMGVIWPKRSGTSEIEIDRFLTHQLHRERASLADLQNHPEIEPLARETYAILTAIAADGEDRQSLARLDRTRRKFEEKCQLAAAAAEQSLAARDGMAARL
jgi:hypothetical protein